MVRFQKARNQPCEKYVIIGEGQRFLIEKYSGKGHCSEMEDAKIVELYWSRSEDAIKESRDKYGAYCYAIAYNVLYSDPDAEECVNDTYMNAWENIPPKKPILLGAFLGKITRNIALNRYVHDRAQKRSGGTEVLFEEVEGILTDGEDITDTVALRDAINSFLGELRKKDRVVFVQRYWYMCPVSDISREFGISESAVKVILHRTRNKFRDYLNERGINI